jgi:hypothetical protein
MSQCSFDFFLHFLPCADQLLWVLNSYLIAVLPVLMLKSICTVLPVRWFWWWWTVKKKDAECLVNLSTTCFPKWIGRVAKTFPVFPNYYRDLPWWDFHALELKLIDGEGKWELGAIQQWMTMVPIRSWCHQMRRGQCRRWQRCYVGRCLTLSR